MDKNDVVELFETVLTALACPFALPIIANRDIKMDIPKVNLKKEEPPMAIAPTAEMVHKSEYSCYDCK